MAKNVSEQARKEEEAPVEGPAAVESVSEQARKEEEAPVEGPAAVESPSPNVTKLTGTLAVLTDMVGEARAREMLGL